MTSNLKTSPLAGKVADRNVHIGPSDYVEWLDDRKWAYVRLEGSAFGEVPLNLEYKLEVWDSPNSAGIIIDAVRAAVTKKHGVQPADVRIIGVGEIPRSSAHKIARRVAAKAYNEGVFN